MDVNLDSLSREEKEALLTKKMDMIRQRNKALSERHKVVSCAFFFFFVIVKSVQTIKSILPTLDVPLHSGIEV